MAVDAEVTVEVVPLTTVTLAEPEGAGLPCSGEEDEVELDPAGVDAAGVDSAGTDAVWVTAWLVV